MIKANKKLGNMYLSSDDNTVTKEEFQEALKNGSVSDFYTPTSRNYKEYIACSDIEGLDAVVLEDSTGILHIMPIPFLNEIGIDIDEFLVLKEVDFNKDLTEFNGPLYDYKDLTTRRSREAFLRLQKKFENE